MKKRSWTELRKSVKSWTSWASWGTGRAVCWTSSLKLDQLDELVQSWTGLTKPCACGKRAKQLESVSGQRGAYG
ncbi:hypothetical protein F2Q69_00024328 [Brassica cretica]|uniref:Uncharacterized protein n=1 Tax=Brassica cretica TaxID=69181 RepID=A0A8S9Q4T7_BRACR|nr:hypothetical protein F2Q69_00024328 [Brassica cretica]